jgi:hypothetical protein
VIAEDKNPHLVLRGVRWEKRLKPPRDVRLDLARGVALLVIFIDHVPNSWLHQITPQRWQFCDFAEVFVFVSGYSAALAYGPLFEERGWWAAQRKALARCWTLYWAHLLTLAATLLTVHIGLQLGLHPPFRSLELFEQAPGAYFWRALYFGYAPFMFSVLPLYVVLVMALPAMLALARWSSAATLGSSLLLYVATSWMWGAWIAPGRGYPPNDDAWYFDPAAWQLVFVLGLLAPRFRWPESFNPIWIRLLAFGAVVEFGLWALMHFNGHDWARPGAEKPQLDPLRLANFVAWLILAEDWLGRVPANRWLVACGRRSLLIFCTGAWLAISIGIAISGMPDPIIPTLLMVAGAGLLLLLPLAARRSAPKAARAQPVRQQVGPSGEIG